MSDSGSGAIVLAQAAHLPRRPPVQAGRPAAFPHSPDGLRTMCQSKCCSPASTASTTGKPFKNGYGGSCSIDQTLGDRRSTPITESGARTSIPPSVRDRHVGVRVSGHSQCLLNDGRGGRTPQSWTEPLRRITIRDTVVVWHRQSQSALTIERFVRSAN